MKKILMSLIMTLVMIAGVSAVVAGPSIDFYRGDNGCAAQGDYYGGDLGDWGVAPNGSAGYGGEGRDHFCMIIGPVDCSDTDTWVLSMHPTEPVNMIKVRYLDGQKDDTFSIYVRDHPESARQLVATISAPESSTETWKESDWLVLPFTLPANQESIIEFVGEAPIQPWCETWGQIAVDYIDFSYEEEIPEFGTIALLVALIGGLAAVVLMRRN